ncbi:hypothetical protein DB44_CL00080 [Candidatus Protochlamydia amoebophila]|uniref:Uncharacterized protein n=1 Tax=Candidatus Protochlamydia amoebophila TaxID=362787 RepID=A0A0C1JP25_9BACT|nr:hypothetical protein DB44_CL00080 [Candidatus Protochlamydia amoebophila]
MKCPDCGCQVIVKNGRRKNDKQNRNCLSLNRQFVELSKNKMISEKTEKKFVKPC